MCTVCGKAPTNNSKDSLVKNEEKCRIPSMRLKSEQGLLVLHGSHNTILL
jgi:hypothetical protein